MLSVCSDFRLLANLALREALTSGKTARGSLARFASQQAKLLHLNFYHALAATDLAVALARAHRGRLRRHRASTVPYLRRLFLRTSHHCFHFDPQTGKLRLSLRSGEWISFQVHVAPYHRSILAKPGLRVTQLHLTPERAILIYGKPAPEPYAPESLLALDTNEGTLDGVTVAPKEGTHAVRVDFSEIPTIQSCHAKRRRHLARKKATDRRVGKRLLNREGRREHDRVRSRLHPLTKQLVAVAAAHRAALAIEDLSQMPHPRRRGRLARRKPSTRRRLSSWPRGELNRQLAYKAAEWGVPIYWVNPFRTSRTCPRCGGIAVPRSRVGPVFVCPQCAWSLDRQLNAGANIGRIVLRETKELGGLRLDLDALLDEAMTPRYPFECIGRAREERTGREGRPLKDSVQTLLQ
ncbi:MAG: zinc ribbon domain-containing protein [Thermoplasmata archaeon]|nr:zinc ribbon domain-containing protein [Thermoplasmata archaeon]